MQKRRNYNSAFKSKVTLSYLKGDMTMSELCSHHKLSSSCIHKWRKIALSKFSTLLDDNKKSGSNTSFPNNNFLSESEAEKLYSEIGRLKMERDFLSKKLEG